MSALAPATDEDVAVNAVASSAAVLELYRCDACGALHSYPRAACPHCGGETRRVPVSGRGTVYSYTVVHRAPTPALRSETPYVIVIVRTAEGPHVMGRLEGTDIDAVRIGMEVVIAPPRHLDRGYYAFVGVDATQSMRAGESQA